MKKPELNHRIPAINSARSLESSKRIPGSETESEIINLSDEEIRDIILSKKEITDGSYIEHSTLDIEVKQWLKAR